ncbi:MAG: hypothetical protein H6766_05610 [Candidatus Peribacteria bacterium]|nr:MAG: hypothetical protein H6766_05610 [Candidatus Peribacteria bacterium]
MDRILLPVYDFDGNVLSPQTVNFFENTMTGEIVEILAHDVDQNPWLYFESGQFKFPNDEAENAFQRFRDYYLHDSHPGPDGLLIDTQDAIKEGNFPPSFENFKQLALIDAEMFAILTARGHSPDNLQRAIELIAREVLTNDEHKERRENIKKKYGGYLEQYKVSNNNIDDRYFAHIPTYIGVNNINFCKQSHIDWYKGS